ncbi:hypothetical protein E4U51_002914 [Claviceps purpurea]|nr:hypothetical protein E4U51_002914 [Claviceps purpurea]
MFLPNKPRKHKRQHSITTAGKRVTETLRGCIRHKDQQNNASMVGRGFASSYLAEHLAQSDNANSYTEYPETDVHQAQNESTNMERPVGVGSMNSASVELSATSACFLTCHKTVPPATMTTSIEIVSEGSVAVTFDLK